MTNCTNSAAHRLLFPADIWCHVGIDFRSWLARCTRKWQHNTWRGCWKESWSWRTRRCSCRPTRRWKTTQRVCTISLTVWWESASEFPGKMHQQTEPVWKPSCRDHNRWYLQRADGAVLSPQGSKEDWLKEILNKIAEVLKLQDLPAIQMQVASLGTAFPDLR